MNYVIGVYLILAVILPYVFYKRNLKSLSSLELKFKKQNPFLPYGDIIVEFQHVFQHNKKILEEILKGVNQSLTEKTPLTSMEKVEIIDKDKKFTSTDKREFSKGTGEPTLRGSNITIFLYHDFYGQMQNFQWWILVNNPIRRKKVFTFLATSIITLPFWIYSYLRGTYNIAAGLRKPYGAFYEDMDLIMQIRSIHEAIINTLVEILDAHGIDTSDLKTQKAQIMNINVSGGKTTFGNIMQGAINKVTRTKSGGK